MAKWRREIDRSEDKGPLPKAKRRSMKLANQKIKKADMPARCREWRVRWRKNKRAMTGMIARSLVLPLGMMLDIK